LSYCMYMASLKKGRGHGTTGNAAWGLWQGGSGGGKGLMSEETGSLHLDSER
jgi:hypothetical protein